ncbi:MAG: hypothetical protein R3E48_16495 [Burkholderiaceae bacterium]
MKQVIIPVVLALALSTSATAQTAPVPYPNVGGGSGSSQGGAKPVKAGKIRGGGSGGGRGVGDGTQKSVVGGNKSPGFRVGAPKVLVEGKGVSITGTPPAGGN